MDLIYFVYTQILTVYVCGRDLYIHYNGGSKIWLLILKLTKFSVLYVFE